MMRLASVLLAALLWFAAPASAQMTATGVGGGFGPAAGGGGIAVVQNTPCIQTTAVNPIVCTIPATASGNVLVVAGYYSAAGFPTTSVTDSASDTSTDSGLGDNYDGNSVIAFIKAFLTASSGVTTITINLSAVAGGNFQIYEIAGLASKVFDSGKINSNINSTTVNLVSGATGTLTASSAFAVAVFTDYATAMTGAGGGFTVDVTNTNGTTGISYNNMSQIVSSNASLTASTTAAGVVLGFGNIATLK